MGQTFTFLWSLSELLQRRKEKDRNMPTVIFPAEHTAITRFSLFLPRSLPPVTLDCL